jgi:hypothetical protein
LSTLVVHFGLIVHPRYSFSILPVTQRETDLSRTRARNETRFMLFSRCSNYSGRANRGKLAIEKVGRIKTVRARESLGDEVAVIEIFFRSTRTSGYTCHVSAQLHISDARMCALRGFSKTAYGNEFLIHVARQLTIMLNGRNVNVGGASQRRRNRRAENSP